ncbi:MAG TPA: response regulator, partial [Chloroflexi bacterium]|nr:response regulator [Chloroflexota bacterium]
EAITLVQMEHPDIIVLDLMMPGVDGFDVLESVKANKDTRGIPIIVVTAKELTKKERQVLNKGVETLLQKGLFEQQELLADVASALDRLSMNSQRQDTAKDEPENETTPQKIARESK